MKRGPKPKPTHLKVVEGNPGRRPLNVNEPVAEGDLQLPPEWMTESQKAGWAYAVKHAPLGVLKKIDRAILSVWVVAEDLHREATLKVAQFGILTKAPKTELPIQSPYLPVINRQAEIMLRAAAELGFTPSARSGLNAGDGDGESRANRFRGHGQRPA